MVEKIAQDLRTMLEQTVKGQVERMNLVGRKMGCQAEQGTEYQTEKKMGGWAEQRMADRADSKMEQKAVKQVECLNLVERKMVSRAEQKMGS